MDGFLETGLMAGHHETQLSGTIRTEYQKKGESLTVSDLVGALQNAIAGMSHRPTHGPRVANDLTFDLARSIPSFLGFTITLQTGFTTALLSTVNPAIVRTADACLLVLLSPDSEPGSSAVFYADEPRAFDRVATSNEWGLYSVRAIVLNSGATTSTGNTYSVHPSV